MKSRKTNKSVYVVADDWTKALAMGVNISEELAKLLRKLINKKTCSACGKVLFLVLSCGIYAAP